MTIQEQAKEIVERNKGNISDTIKVLDQMLLIYTVINCIHDYLEIALDLSNLKMCLLIELEKYNKK